MGAEEETTKLLQSLVASLSLLLKFLMLLLFFTQPANTRLAPLLTSLQVRLQTNEQLHQAWHQQPTAPP
jgi:hypothetical protein